MIFKYISKLISSSLNKNGQQGKRKQITVKHLIDLSIQRVNHCIVQLCNKHLKTSTYLKYQAYAIKK
jgi:hypothetical protein